MGYERRKEEPRTKNDENLQTRGLKEWELIPRNKCQCGESWFLRKWRRLGFSTLEFTEFP